jgi:hypothetical protein
LRCGRAVLAHERRHRRSDCERVKNYPPVRSEHL